MTDQLKPCPFCGVHLYDQGTGYEHPYSDTCPLDSLYIEDRHVDAWNTRAPADASPAFDPADNDHSCEMNRVKGGHCIICGSVDAQMHADQKAKDEYHKSIAKSDSRQKVKVKPLVWESVGKGWVASDDLFNVTRYAESTESRDEKDNAREARILAALDM